VRAMLAFLCSLYIR
jgi:hypothetical protein